jgi:hypothetical protein
VQRWGGLGPFLLKVEPEEFVEEAAPAPVPIPTPVSVVHIGLVHSFLINFSFPGELYSADSAGGRELFISFMRGITFSTFFLSSPFSFISSKILL